jgi:hypothetical protein
MQRIYVLEIFNEAYRLLSASPHLLETGRLQEVSA